MVCWYEAGQNIIEHVEHVEHHFWAAKQFLKQFRVQLPEILLQACGNDSKRLNLG